MTVTPSLEGIEKLKKLKGDFLDSDSLALKIVKQNLGWVGIIVGNNEEKAGNIAFITIIISFILIGCIIFTPKNHENTSKDRLLLIPSGFITLSLGYLFGKR